MKINIELSLRTREVYQLFERKINGERMFIEAILHKFNTVINRCQQQNSQALLIYKQINQKILELTQQFMEETTTFEFFIAKKKNFDNKKANFIVQFRPTIAVTNPLAMQLIELIDAYDKLVAMLKLLHLAGCFENDSAYFGNVRRIQKTTNQLLSHIALLSSV